jgi:hypothetical protein
VRGPGVGTRDSVRGVSVLRVSLKVSASTFARWWPCDRQRCALRVHQGEASGYTDSHFAFSIREWHRPQRRSLHNARRRGSVNHLAAIRCHKQSTASAYLSRKPSRTLMSRAPVSKFSCFILQSSIYTGTLDTLNMLHSTAGSSVDQIESVPQHCNDLCLGVFRHNDRRTLQKRNVTIEPGRS